MPERFEEEDADALIKRAVAKAEKMRSASEYQPGQVIELEGWPLRVVDVIPPTAYRDYAIMVLAAVRQVAPATVWARIDQDGVHFRVPEGWRKC